MMRHRTALAASVIVVILGALPEMLAQQPAVAKQTFVFVHGAWGGGWDWRPVADILTSRGHVVFRATLTGLGERVHLATPDIGLETHITDVVNTIQYENLRDVTLVGHSYGGMVITGVADRVPERLGHLVYVDAFVPENGESLITLNAANGNKDLTAVGGFVVPSWVKPGAPPPTDVPQPAKTFTDLLTLKNPLRARLPTTYILTVDSGATTDRFDPYAARATAKGWRVQRLTADHNAQRSARDELCALLERIR